jgi:hypothetical protein
LADTAIANYREDFIDRKEAMLHGNQKGRYIMEKVIS